jgi:membrane protein DedA with SNARE-associated domain
MLEFLHKIALDLGFWIYPIVGAELFFESSAFLGMVLPADSVVILMGILTGTDVASLAVTIPLILGCVFLADVSGYMLGSYKGEAILARSKMGKAPLRSQA